MVAVLTAMPVALWTVTAFVRAYVAPPKLPTFRQLATNVTEQQESTGSTTAAGDQSLWQSVTTFVRAHVAGPQISSVRQLAEMLTGNSGATSPKGDANSPAAEQARPSASSSMTVEATATATDARDLPGSSKEQSANGDNMPASMAKMVDAPPTSMASKSTDMPVARAADMTAPNAWPPAAAAECDAADQCTVATRCRSRARCSWRRNRMRRNKRRPPARLWPTPWPPDNR